MTQEYLVENGRQRYRFVGELLAFSSSRSYGKNRWIEFALYKSNAGSYVLSRIGCSNVFHAPGCDVVRRSDNLEIGKPAKDGVPCPFCLPSREDGVLLPERQRTYASVSDTAVGVVESLHQYDNDGGKYLTLVARSLLESAAEVDDGIHLAYFDQFIA